MTQPIDPTPAPAAPQTAARPGNFSLVVAPPKPRRHWLRILLVLVVFLSGSIVGSGVTVMAMLHRARTLAQHPEFIPARLAERIRNRVGLTPEQTAQVRQILIRRQKAINEIRQDVRPQVARELDGSYEEISAELTPEQKQAWREMYHRLRAEWLPPVQTAPGR